MLTSANPSFRPLGLTAPTVSLIKLHTEVHKADIADFFQAGIFSEYKDLFDEAQGELPVVYRMQVDENENPVIGPTYRIPLAMEGVRKELNRMVQLKVTTPGHEPTERVSQMMAAKKKNGDIRICIDPRDLNTALKRPHH